MHLVYMDESGNTGLDLHNADQPVFVLAALIVPEERWSAAERELLALINTYFPTERPARFEIHATAIRNGTGYFRGFGVDHRVRFRDGCFDVAARHGFRVIYRSVRKKRFARWTYENFGSAIAINPHVAAFPFVARAVNAYLLQLPGSPKGIFICDENREIIGDVEKTISLLRGIEGDLRLSQIVEKGFFIDSAKSVLLQLCDLCAYHARKRAEQQYGMPVKPLDVSGIERVEALMHGGGRDADIDTLQWLIERQHEKKERPGD